MESDTDQEAGLRAYLATNDGSAVLDAIDAAIWRACRHDGGAVRADDVIAVVGGNPDTKRAAVDYLVETGLVREVKLSESSHRVLIAA